MRSTSRPRAVTPDTLPGSRLRQLGEAGARRRGRASGSLLSCVHKRDRAAPRAARPTTSHLRTGAPRPRRAACASDRPPACPSVAVEPDSDAGRVAEHAGRRASLGDRDALACSARRSARRGRSARTPSKHAGSSSPEARAGRPRSPGRMRRPGGARPAGADVIDGGLQRDDALHLVHAERPGRRRAPIAGHQRREHLGEALRPGDRARLFDEVGKPVWRAHSPRIASSVQVLAPSRERRAHRRRR